MNKRMDNRVYGFISEWDFLADKAEQIAQKHGFFHENDAEALMLIVSELSEGLESLREGNPFSDHIPEFTGIEEELADVIIRIMHLSSTRGWKIAQAVLAKIKYNESRPFKHGGKKF